MKKVKETLLIMAIVFIILSGFTINFNNFHWEYKGLIEILVNA